MGNKYKRRVVNIEIVTTQATPLEIGEQLQKVAECIENAPDNVGVNIVIPIEGSVCSRMKGEASFSIRETDKAHYEERD